MKNTVLVFSLKMLMYTWTWNLNSKVFCSRRLRHHHAFRNFFLAQGEWSFHKKIHLLKTKIAPKIELMSFFVENVALICFVKKTKKSKKMYRYTVPVLYFHYSIVCEYYTIKVYQETILLYYCYIVLPIRKHTNYIKESLLVILYLEKIRKTQTYE